MKGENKSSTESNQDNNGYKEALYQPIGSNRDIDPNSKQVFGENLQQSQIQNDYTNNIKNGVHDLGKPRFQKNNGNSKGLKKTTTLNEKSMNKNSQSASKIGIILEESYVDESTYTHVGATNRNVNFTTRNLTKNKPNLETRNYILNNIDGTNPYSTDRILKTTYNDIFYNPSQINPAYTPIAQQQFGETSRASESDTNNIYNSNSVKNIRMNKHSNFSLKGNYTTRNANTNYPKLYDYNNNTQNSSTKSKRNSFMKGMASGPNTPFSNSDGIYQRRHEQDTRFGNFARTEELAAARNTNILLGDVSRKNKIFDMRLTTINENNVVSERMINVDADNSFKLENVSKLIVAQFDQEFERDKNFVKDNKNLNNDPSQTTKSKQYKSSTSVGLKLNNLANDEKQKLSVTSHNEFTHNLEGSDQSAKKRKSFQLNLLQQKNPLANFQNLLQILARGIYQIAIKNTSSNLDQQASQTKTTFPSVKKEKSLRGNTQTIKYNTEGSVSKHFDDVLLAKKQANKAPGDNLFEHANIILANYIKNADKPINQVLNLHKVKSDDETDKLWKKGIKNDKINANKSLCRGLGGVNNAASFGKAVRTDVYTDQTGRLIRTKSQFGNIAGQQNASNPNSKLNTNKNIDLLNGIEKVKMNQKNCTVYSHRNFQLDGSLKNYYRQQYLNANECGLDAENSEQYDQIEGDYYTEDANTDDPSDLYNPSIKKQEYYNAMRNLKINLNGQQNLTDESCTSQQQAKKQMAEEFEAQYSTRLNDPSQTNQLRTEIVDSIHEGKSSIKDANTKSQNPFFLTEEEEQQKLQEMRLKRKSYHITLKPKDESTISTRVKKHLKKNKQDENKRFEILEDAFEELSNDDVVNDPRYQIEEKTSNMRSTNFSSNKLGTNYSTSKSTQSTAVAKKESGLSKTLANQGEKWVMSRKDYEDDVIDRILQKKLKDSAQALKEFAFRKLTRRQNMYMTCNDRIFFGDSIKARGTTNVFDSEILTDVLHNAKKQEKENEKKYNEKNNAYMNKTQKGHGNKIGANLTKVYNDLYSQSEKDLHESQTTNVNTRDKKIEKKLIKNYLRNIEYFSKIGPDGKKTNHSAYEKDTKNLTSNTFRSQQQLLRPIFPKPEVDFGYKGVNYPGKKALVDHEFDIYKTGKENKQGDLKFGPKLNEDYNYPKCWDTCRFCSDNGVINCLESQECGMCLESNQEKTGSCGGANILIENQDTIKGNSTQKVKIEETKKISDSVNQKNENTTNILQMVGKYTHDLIWDKEKLFKAFNMNQDAELIETCFQTNSIQFFEKRESFEPEWKKTFAEYKKLFDNCNGNKDAVLTKFILKATEQWKNYNKATMLKTNPFGLDSIKEKTQESLINMIKVLRRLEDTGTNPETHSCMHTNSIEMSPRPNNKNGVSYTKNNLSLYPNESLDSLADAIKMNDQNFAEKSMANLAIMPKNISSGNQTLGIAMRELSPILATKNTGPKPKDDFRVVEFLKKNLGINPSIKTPLELYNIQRVQTEFKDPQTEAKKLKKLSIREQLLKKHNTEGGDEDYEKFNSDGQNIQNPNGSCNQLNIINNKETEAKNVSGTGEVIKLRKSLKKEAQKSPYKFESMENIAEPSITNEQLIQDDKQNGNLVNRKMNLTINLNIIGPSSNKINTDINGQRSPSIIQNSNHKQIQRKNTVREINSEIANENADNLSTPLGLMTLKDIYNKNNITVAKKQVTREEMKYLTEKDHADLKKIEDRLASKQKNFIVGAETLWGDLKSTEVKNTRISRNNVTKKENEMYQNYCRQKAVIINESVTYRESCLNSPEKTKRLGDASQRKVEKKFEMNTTLKGKIRRICPLIIEFLLKLRECHIDIEDIVKNAAIPKRSYQIKGSKEFFVQVKMGNHEAVNEALDKNKFLLFQIDSLGKTPLHRAVIMKDDRMIQNLLRFYPDVNKRDFNGKTPLSYAVEADYFQGAKLLLLQKARPWFDDNRIYTNWVKSQLMYNLLKKTKKFWVSLALFRPLQKDLEWTKRSQNYIN